jgi:hypothetical protein
MDLYLHYPGDFYALLSLKCNVPNKHPTCSYWIIIKPGVAADPRQRAPNPCHLLQLVYPSAPPSCTAEKKKSLDQVPNRPQQSPYTIAMATVAPPPAKRQKREHLERTQRQQDVSTAIATVEGTMRVSFQDPDGKRLTEAVEIPRANSSNKDLSLLLNTLLQRVCTHRLPCLEIRFTNFPSNDCRTEKTSFPTASRDG